VSAICTRCGGQLDTGGSCWCHHTNDNLARYPEPVMISALPCQNYISLAQFILDCSNENGALDDDDAKLQWLKDFIARARPFSNAPPPKGAGE